MFESTCSSDVQSVKGLKNIFFSGQGLFTVSLTGPGKVYLQTLTASDMAQKLDPYIARSTVSASSGSSSSSNDD